MAKLRYVRKKGVETVIHSKGMTTELALSILDKRIDKRAEELKVYERFYKHYISLEKKQREDESLRSYLERHSDFFES